MPADQLAFVVLQDARGGRVHVGEAARRVAVVNQVLRMLDDVAQALFAGSQRPLGEPAIGHVAVIDDDGVNRGIVEPVHGDRFDVPPRAILVAHAVLGGHRDARALQALVEHRARRRDVLGVHQLEGAPSEPLFQRVAEQARATIRSQSGSSRPRSA